MDYGRIIQEAWRITWANRFLWVFGLFVGVSGGSCGGSWGNAGGGGGGPFEDLDTPEFGRAFEEIGRWVTNNLGLILAATAVVMLVGLVLIVLHFIAKGALIGSSARLALGEPTSRSEGWALGRRLAWRYARLTVLAMLVGLVVLAIVGVAALMVVAAAQVSGVLAAVLGVVLGLVGLVGLVVGGIGFSVVLAYAERAIAVDDLGARAAFRRGLAVLRLHLGPSFILWIVSLALAIGMGIAFLVLALVLLVPIGGVVFVAYLSAGFGATTIVLGIVGLLIFMLAMWVLGGIASAFTNTFWTLGYLGATGRWGAR